ncbi:hypothetical protein V8B55DRAFT_1511228 [Mucor lusitanicus]|uniref:Uncharacterized protein n=1 Tax=Mucor circinelloides f. lusitanicus TaxID=29924 RepID=A0A8H4BKN3_MUCCL|nr:hypothetical protein FB192DRAFT_1371236 [Mucor lusitanicus]
MRFYTIFLSLLVVLSLCLSINAQQSISYYSQNHTLHVRSANLERRSLLARQQQEPVIFPSSSTTPVSSKDPIFALVIFVALSSLMF